MIDASNIILISYPTGGFGNFLFHTLTEFSDQTYKPDNSNFSFSVDGNSHLTKKYTKKWFRNPDNYEFVKIDTDKKILILCDNGFLHDSYDKIDKFFINAQIVRTVITEPIRPVIYKTCIYKGMRSNFSNVRLNETIWEHYNEDYSKRENFSLMYHTWGYEWNPIIRKNLINLNLEELVKHPKQTISNCIRQLGGNVIHESKLDKICDQWKNHNYEYFKIYYDWADIKTALESNQYLDLRQITDLHDQGYINYCIEKLYSVTIPTYDYKHWFNDTDEIKSMVKKLKYV